MYALKRLGLLKDARRIAEKYIKTFDYNFTETGKIWGKYDATTGKVGQSFEYETPEMRGWSAGVYVYFDEELKKI